MMVATIGRGRDHGIIWFFVAVCGSQCDVSGGTYRHILSAGALEAYFGSLEVWKLGSLEVGGQVG